ncbi:UTP--glucose-1-phosphate uridylyltransferase [Citrus sinensis]|uniref:UTP--glucose-1-phosphate uridylyltransferase n=1 Tax=Citrus sinensis TaxID=2711 RepID=A0ACB8M607_CITSI|nr:UTP--glucose-1-phosphate uridylyltransferase [Citrus sinensis]
MAIIDSDKTLICLRNACHFISLLARQRAAFMFVNTNPLFDEIVLQMTQKIGCYNPNMNALWRMGGFLTNSSSPKKFRSRNKKIRFGPTKLPDCVVVLDTERKSSVIMEAAKLQVPIVALVDSSMPLDVYSKITYPVPGNDSVQFVYLLCNMITKTFLVEQKKLGLLKDDEDQRERIDSKKGNGEKVGLIETKREIDSKDEILVVPYESLASISEDIAETKMLLDKLVVVKFNGALGTNMGFSAPKSAIEVKNNLTPLDLMVDQVEVLEKYSNSKVDIHSLSLSQQTHEKSFEGHSRKDKLYPSSDHSVVFLSLMKSGTLDLLLVQGKEYALVVDSDNVAAVADPSILVLVLVAPVPSIDLRNSLINLRPGKFQLVDITQNPTKQTCNIIYVSMICSICSFAFLADQCFIFCFIMVKKSGGKFKFINTRSMWVNLRAIKRLIDTDELKIENFSSSKEVNDDQIISRGTAADSAIQFFDHTIGINVAQSRYLPVNSTSDLLLLQSDLYTADEGILVQNPARDNPANPSIELGPEFEKVNNFQSRFKSIPSIINLDSLKVEGDVWFGAGITLKGKVSIVAKRGMKLEIPDGIVLENKEIKDVADI